MITSRAWNLSCMLTNLYTKCPRRVLCFDIIHIFESILSVPLGILRHSIELHNLLFFRNAKVLLFCMKCTKHAKRKISGTLLKRKAKNNLRFLAIFPSHKEQ